MARDVLRGFSLVFYRTKRQPTWGCR